MDNLKFTKLIFKKTIEQQLKTIENELFYDCSSTLHLLRENNKEKEVEQLLFFLSKYSFFITYFSDKEEYEVCNEIHNHLIVLIGMFGYSRDRIKELISTTLEQYKKQNINWDEE